MFFAGNIVTTKQMRERRELLSPGKLVQHAPEVHHMYGACLAGQWRMMRPQQGEPTENMRGTAQLVQRAHGPMLGPEITQKVAGCSSIGSLGVIAHRTRHRFRGGAEGLR